MNFNDAVLQLKAGSRIKRNSSPDINYFILGVSDGCEILEASVKTPVGSTFFSQIMKYHFTWDDVTATDWEIV